MTIRYNRNWVLGIVTVIVMIMVVVLVRMSDG
jgi:hypothetical protein